MRISLNFKVKKDTLLNYNYNHFIAGVIYKSIENNLSNFGNKLHNLKGPKLFTFSQLFFREAQYKKEGIYLKKGTNFYFFVSSVHLEILFSLIRKFSVNKEVNINNLTAELISEPKILKYNLDSYLFKTLSPIIVTKKKNNKTIDLSPADNMFFTSLEENLKKKYKLQYGKEYNSIIKIENWGKYKRKRLQIKTTHHIAYHFDKLRIFGNQDILKIALDAGLGEKNSMGFGMIV